MKIWSRLDVPRALVSFKNEKFILQNEICSMEWMSVDHVKDVKVNNFLLTYIWLHNTS